MNEEHKRKIGESNKGRKSIKYWLGKKRPDMIGDKNPARKLGVGKKISEAKKGIATRGAGWHTSEETKRKISSAIKKVYKKENHRSWKGGISIGKNRRAYIAFKALERLVRKKGNGGSHTFEEWETLKAQYNWICPSCNKPEPEIKLTQDHIVPLVKGGSDNIENIQPLCGGCNSKKNTETIIFKIRSGVLLGTE